MENIKPYIEPDVVSREDIPKSANSVQDALGIDDSRKMEIKVIVDGFKLGFGNATEQEKQQNKVCSQNNIELHRCFSFKKD